MEKLVKCVKEAIAEIEAKGEEIKTIGFSTRDYKILQKTNYFKDIDKWAFDTGSNGKIDNWFRIETTNKHGYIRGLFEGMAK